MEHPPHSQSSVSFIPGTCRNWLRAEGFFVLVLSLAFYANASFSWPLFLVLFLVPDLTIAAYFAGPRTGAIFYNCAHSYIGPIALIITGLVLPLATARAIGLVWASHIAFDRMLGYGLKYSSGFRDTHLGPLRVREKTRS